ncbi:DUF938 domain-containing protein [Psychrobacter sp. FDAARGOS_221]|uniref:DUF938 domain-containing protein n=1 Tax=Psychrobacter sp. FDAARGOS_221 TaxID=1975705 RepID=UPI000BB58961|nr:DUF938 domain-containing protein [Psychrobacter sp. FDAARGOS_221]PNK60108.1 DUF938 domain-containing protein [Psychrobacter sp. FDAARGOS_221]
MNKESLGNTDVNHTSRLPFSQACENNKDPILQVLQQELRGYSHVLEVGSGTGQHSVYFAPRLPHLQWQTSDVVNNHRVIEVWQDRHPAPNLHAPLTFDLNSDDIPLPVSAKADSETNSPYDAVFTANTLHIIGWLLVERLFELVGEALPAKGKFIVYGPFNENGQYSSDSNRQFDSHLRQRDPNSGIRDKNDLVALAKQHQLILSQQYKMPANNEILVFIKN